MAVEPRTDEPEVRFAPGAQVFAQDGAELVVSATSWHSGRMMVSFLGVDDRTAAEALRGTVLEIDVDPTVLPAEAESFYDHQLIGLTAQTPSAENLGTVSEVVHAPGQDLLVVLTGLGQEVMVPFVAQIVPEVDLDGGRVIVSAPDGMFDTDEPPSDSDRPS